MTVLNKDKILEAAKDFITQAKYDKAIREYEKLLQADPKDMRIKLRIAELYAKCRQIPQAIRAYREVAESYTQEGFYLKGVTVYKSILRLNPSLLDINQALADLYERMGLAQDAIHQYEILAQAYEQKNQFQESLKIRQKLVELAPQEAIHRIRLAESYQREEKKEEAIEQYEVLAKQYREQKKETTRLIELYERILPHRPQNKEMFKDLVRLYYDKKDYKAALKWLESQKQTVVEETELLEWQAEIYTLLNQLDSARGKYQELAELHLKKGDKEKTLAAYGEILAILPEEAETIRPLVEAIERGAMETVLEKSMAKRLKRIEEERSREALRQAQDTAEKQDVEKQRSPSTSSGHGKEAPKASKAPPITLKPKPMSTNDVATWLKKAHSALSLAKAYQETGLETEAKQEWTQAKEALKKILEIEAGHAEALRLLRELEAPQPPTPTTKSQKKISFV